MDVDLAYLDYSPCDHNHPNEVIQEVKFVYLEVEDTDQSSPEDQPQGGYDAAYFLSRYAQLFSPINSYLRSLTMASPMANPTFM